jgi:hypothetical protein
MPVITKQAVAAKPRAPERQAGVVGRIGKIGFGEDEGISMNIYGRSGTGKTTVAATFPKPACFLVCSGGSRPGELRSIDTPTYQKVIDQLVLQKSTDVDEFVDYQRDTGHYATIVLDHATGLQDMVLKEILKLDRIPEQLSWGLASQQEYGQVALQVKTLLRRILDLDCNRVVLAQERDFNTEADGEIIQPYVASALTPSIVGWLGPACDYVCQTFIREQVGTREIEVGGKKVRQQSRTGRVEYCLRTAPSPIYAAKFRVPKGTPLPDCIVDPSYDKIIKLIKGGR